MEATNVFEALETRRKQGVACALVILVDSQGSVPAKKGAKMLVAADGSTTGTVGGGAMEQDAVQTGLQTITEGEARLVHMELTEAAGYACGGRATLYIEPILPAPRLVICGAGHVGQAVCHVAAYVGFSVTAIDDREAFASPDVLPDADHVAVHAFDRLFADIPIDAETFITVCTRGHAHDFTVVQRALQTPARYIGLLGSRRKRDAFFEKLRDAGFSDNDLERVYTPVGLDIGAGSPREIAVSIVGELIDQRRCHARKNGGPSPGRRGFQADGQQQAAAPCAG